MRTRRPSSQTINVVSSLLAQPDAWRYGYDLCQELGIKSGTLYPILMRLADRGYLETKWSESDRSGRPPRHLYRLTRDGRIWATEILTDAGRRVPTLEPATGDAT